MDGSEVRNDRLDVPTTVLLGRGWSGAGRGVRHLARRLARQLQHAVETCDLAEPDQPLRRLARSVAERGARRLVLLPVALEDGRLAGAELESDPVLRLHRGRAPAADDIARMLGDRARDATRSLASAPRQPAQVAVVIATGGGANPASNAEVARLARLVFEAHGFGEVSCAFLGLTTPSVGEAILRAARLGARGVVVVPHLLFDARGHRHLVKQARAGAGAARVEVTVARTLDTHPGLVWALARRHLEALTEGGGATAWVNPNLRLLVEHAHGRHLVGEEEARLAKLLPARYWDSARVVSSAPMGAAPLQRDDDGQVAWDQMWQGFCELALAGGPPHRGTLLEAVSSDDARADPERYAAARAELARGLTMVTGLPVVLEGPPGWIGLRCDNEEMAIWLMRAIIVENIMVRREGTVLCVPIGCRFTLEGEIKNVVTAVAKTYHYWKEHQGAR
ncbi:MAG TPA: CbiX/SirB N-terminal domain-containing protein [Candidatus Bathyarchaeia archaeon]|nr:CbiX/SirB N-terminal domain-containing protein [Candidatus Bathyarchaeia archaeon]